MGISLDFEQIGWSRILDYRKLRNLVGHGATNIERGVDPENESQTKKLKKLRRRLESLPGVEIDAGEVVLDHDFLDQALTSIRTLVSGVGHAVAKAVEDRKGTD